MSDELLRHGYRLDDLHALAQRAAREAARWRYLPYGERYDLAWSAIAETIYASDTRPRPHELIAAGWQAIDRDVLARYQMRGEVIGDAGALRPRFAAYWWSQGSPSRSHEDRIVESVALRQIWGRMSEGRRRALVALAVHEDYETAAGMLGISYDAYKTKIRRARRDFFVLWHEGEEPSRVWGRDHRRRKEGARRNSVTQVTIRARHRRRARRAAARAGAEGRQPPQ